MDRRRGHTVSLGTDGDGDFCQDICKVEDDPKAANGRLYPRLFYSKRIYSSHMCTKKISRAIVVSHSAVHSHLVPNQVLVQFYRVSPHAYSPNTLR